MNDPGELLRRHFATLDGVRGAALMDDDGRTLAEIGVELDVARPLLAARRARAADEDSAWMNERAETVLGDDGKHVVHVEPVRGGALVVVFDQRSVGLVAVRARALGRELDGGGGLVTH